MSNRNGGGYMYQIDEYVMKMNTGLCHIENIVHLDIMGVGKNKLYYLLIPLSDDKSKLLKLRT